ncbi:MAG: hypothetical protein WCF47_16845, partial [Pseudolabrys sp.]
NIQRVVYVVFDNVHLRRDNPNVPSDLEQMPNLLNFILSNGVISGSRARRSAPRPPRRRVLRSH